MPLPGFDLAGTRPWETPEVVAIDRLPMRAPMWPAPDAASARQGARDGSSWFRRLDGTWRFALAPAPEQEPAGFEQRDFDNSHWAQVAVPSCWTMDPDSGDAPIYTNV